MVRYTDEEYENSLTSPTWSRSETDHLMYNCLKYDLRWSVIADRYTLLPPRTTEDMMDRYYGIVTKVKLLRSGATEAHAKSEAFSRFDADYQNKRKIQQECIYRKSNLDDGEEASLKEELKNIDIVLKKMKKSSKEKSILRPILAASEGKPAPVVALSIPSSVDQPVAGKPRLQSARLVSRSDFNPELSQLNQDFYPRSLWSSPLACPGPLRRRCSCSSPS